MSSYIQPRYCLSDERCRSTGSTYFSCTCFTLSTILILQAAHVGSRKSTSNSTLTSLLVLEEVFTLHMPAPVLVQVQFHTYDCSCPGTNPPICLKYMLPTSTWTSSWTCCHCQAPGHDSDHSSACTKNRQRYLFLHSVYDSKHWKHQFAIFEWDLQVAYVCIPLRGHMHIDDIINEAVCITWPLKPCRQSAILHNMVHFLRADLCICHRVHLFSKAMFQYT